MTMASLRWQLKRWTGRLRLPGVLALVLVAAAVGVYFGAVQPGKARIAELEQETQSVRAYARSASETARPEGRDYERWLDQFHGLLPAKESAPEWMRIIFAVAGAHSLALNQGEYKVTVDKHGRLLSYEIRLPVRGNYVQIRRFVADALERVPALALDELTTRREAIGDTTIEASIRFTLFLNAS
jgi:Tfp pilus assembly protein PilO